ncbi:MAG: hypothetical protein LUG96_10170 [Tannerellaceae bacterium]|nr:hypothetical protein [Tannerellaceae bacterium]
MKIFYSIILIAASVFGFLSCSDNDDDGSISSPSYRDRTYSGDNLSVYVGNELIKGVVADVKSEQKDGGDSGIKKDENGNTIYHSDSTYDMTIVLTNFPTASEKTILKTILLDHRDFSGTIQINEKSYTYIGEFTNSPLDPPEEQGCIIRLTVE